MFWFLRFKNHRSMWNILNHFIKKKLLPSQNKDYIVINIYYYISGVSSLLWKLGYIMWVKKLLWTTYFLMIHNTMINFIYNFTVAIINKNSSMNYYMLFIIKRKLMRHLKLIFANGRNKENTFMYTCY